MCNLHYKCRFWRLVVVYLRSEVLTALKMLILLDCGAVWTSRRLPVFLRSNGNTYKITLRNNAEDYNRQVTI
jgi:hypothetical protein